MPARKKRVRTGKKTSHNTDKTFKLVPKAPILALLKLIDLELLPDKSSIVAKAITLPKGIGCAATSLAFSPPCRAAQFFIKMPIR